ncbi:MAG: hypothetical protein ACKVPX_01285 [Myxococcaceae bacterium]
MSDAYPPAVERFHRALERIPGVFDVASGSVSLGEISREALSTPDWAHLPLGAFARTGGPRAGEAFIQFELSIEPSARGWHALEFLGWFVRDLGRAGEAIQLRAFGLAPLVNGQVQLGKTLGFYIDLFFAEPPSMNAAMEKVESLAAKLERALALYAPALGVEASA